jgi:hypothetical protein
MQEIQVPVTFSQEAQLVPQTMQLFFPSLYWPSGQFKSLTQSLLIIVNPVGQIQTELVGDMTNYLMQKLHVPLKTLQLAQFGVVIVQSTH